MAKFNKPGAESARASGPKSPMTVTGTTTTYEGGNAFVRDQKSELYLLAVTNMVGEDTFYEKAKQRDDRFCSLVHRVVLADPVWLYRFLGWLRNKANMRSASVVVAAEAVWARVDAGAHDTFEVVQGPIIQTLTLGSKDFIPQGMVRGDEPGEFVAYWVSKYGKRFPWAVKRGLNAAVIKLFDEYAYAKYGKVTEDGQWGLADIVEMTRPKVGKGWKSDLFRHAINERHSRKEPVPETLPLLRKRAEIMGIPQEERAAFLSKPSAMDEFREAGLTFEAASGWIGKALDASFWEALIPTMGYMALLRNLRNFEKAGISREARKVVQERLADPERVARSKQFPYRFLSAYRAVESDMWGEALSDALDASVGNLPVLPGRTLVLSDTSGSMGRFVSTKSTVTHADIAALFAVALASSGTDVDLYGFAGGGSGWDYSRTAQVTFKHDLPKGGSVLKGIRSFTRRIGEVGHGTELDRAFRETYDGHDRVVIVSDMQAFSSYAGNVTSQCPSDVRLYGLNVAGYKGGVIDLSKRNRYEIGGFSDQVFRMISLLEAGDTNWPF